MRVFFFVKSLMVGMFLLVLPFMAEAHFEYTPITLSLMTKGKENHAIAQIINRENVAVPISIRLTERKQLESGEEERPDTKDLTVFPSQFMLGPKESRSIKISWKGPETVPFEKSYRIIVEEVPVEFTATSADKGTVRILINYIGAIYVNSEKTEGEIALEKVEGVEDEKFINLTFVNKGKAHFVLRSPNIELVAKSTKTLPEKKFKIDKSLIVSADGKNILAQSKIKIRINRPQELLGYDKFEWKFSYEKN